MLRISIIDVDRVEVTQRTCVQWFRTVADVELFRLLYRRVNMQAWAGWLAGHDRLCRPLAKSMETSPLPPPVQPGSIIIRSICAPEPASRLARLGRRPVWTCLRLRRPTAACLPVNSINTATSARFKLFVSAKLHYTDTGYGHVVQHHQRTSSQQFYNLLYNKFTTNGQQFATSQYPIS